MNKDVPDIVIARLPIYLRTLNLLLEDGREITSSQELGSILGISPAQIRKDLSHFGEFGKQGTGYNIQYLISQLRKILHVDREWDMILIGAGALGHAMAHYPGFREQGFNIVAVFDNDPSKIGQEWSDLVVRDAEEMEQFVAEKGIRIAILAVPARAAQDVADRLVNAGIKAILNYAPTIIQVPEGVIVEHIDPIAHLQYMTYYLE